MPRIKANGIEIYYEEYGQGEPLVLIAGIGGTTKGWYCQIKDFAKRRRLIIFDSRGCGKTDNPDMKYTTKLLADDTASLMGALNIKKADILGLSMGGWIAQQLAINYPDKINKLVLACTSDKIYKAGEKLMEAWKILSKKNEVETLAKDFLVWTFSIEYFENHQKELKQLETLMSSAGQPMASYNLLDACLEHNLSEAVSKITASTLVIAGEWDILYPSRLCEILAQKMPNATLTVIEKSGHGIIWEQPEKFNKTVIDFLCGPCDK